MYSVGKSSTIMMSYLCMETDGGASALKMPRNTEFPYIGVPKLT